MLPLPTVLTILTVAQTVLGYKDFWKLSNESDTDFHTRMISYFELHKDHITIQETVYMTYSTDAIKDIDQTTHNINDDVSKFIGRSERSDIIRTYYTHDGTHGGTRGTHGGGYWLYEYLSSFIKTKLHYIHYIISSS